MTLNWPEGGKHLPLWDAVYAGDMAVAQKLLTTSVGMAQVNMPHGLWQKTSVHIAVQRGHGKLLKHLLVAGGDANVRSINGTTPLHIAVGNNRRDLVQDLLVAGGNPLLRNFTGQTSLQLAISLGLKPITTLLRQGADSQQALASLEATAQQIATRRASLTVTHTSVTPQ